VQDNVAKKGRKFLSDIFTTLLDCEWRWTMLVFALSYILTWLFFASLWYLISLAHGDLDNLGKEGYMPCIQELENFASALLFSIETQHTIGYGHRYINEQCPDAIVLLCFQSIIGVFFQAFMVGIVFSKLSRPKKRTQTLLFSKNAVICQRDGALCLMFRVGDLRKSHIVEAHIRAQIIRRKITKEGEVLGFFQQELQVGVDGGDSRLMFIWPTTIVHKITKNSPLYRLSPQDMVKERFEIVAALEGVIETTGMITQARSSYLPSEILWGSRFEEVISFRSDSTEYEVDYTKFDNTYETPTPQVSAYQLDEARNGERPFGSHWIPRVTSDVSLDIGLGSELDMKYNGNFKFGGIQECEEVA